MLYPPELWRHVKNQPRPWLPMWIRRGWNPSGERRYTREASPAVNPASWARRYGRGSGPERAPGEVRGTRREHPGRNLATNGPHYGQEGLC